MDFRSTLPAGPRLRRVRTAALTGVAALSMTVTLSAGNRPVDGVVLTGRTTTATSTPAARGWISTADGTRRVAALSSRELSPTGKNPVQVTVDPTTRYQPVDGFGASMTESSAHLLMGLSASARATALRTLFDPVQGAGVDLVRVPLGASDFALSRYTYDDLPPGQDDPGLASFSVTHDDAEIVPVLQQAQQVDPSLRFLASPWSAPAWMKTSGSLIGGTLRTEDVGAYATYLVRAVQAYQDRGIRFGWLTLQNEPGYAAPDYPSMTLDPQQEAALAAAVRIRLDAAGLQDVQLVGHDHNWADSARADEVLTDDAGTGALAGTAWHCYAGDPTAQSAVHDAHPTSSVWFTECSGGGWATDFGSNLGWGAGNLLIGSVRNWARSVLWWNLALDPSGGPHTGGCGNCRGVVTVDPSTGSTTRNVEWDVLALAGRAVQPGAVRIASTAAQAPIQTVAYANPDGTRVLTAYNSGSSSTTIVVGSGTGSPGAQLPAGAVVTLTW